MPIALIGSVQLYAWRGLSLLVVNTRGECGDDDSLTGYYFREARFLSTLRLDQVNGHAPWLCEATVVAPHLLAFTFIYLPTWLPEVVLHVVHDARRDAVTGIRRRRANRPRYRRSKTQSRGQIQQHGGD